ncbi:zf-U1 domain-containing protein [Cephalotus follicularis]|uniref:Zf-U1 domain-containing protein n=1 Tax=Cephalotus follicularis TaxID=3775 RepID=A0A1Q3B062_CEPFO|nr:zf-U1 domain-containing protein [Cephalotus follicularis]
MTEYWVSQGNKWCDFCKIYISNNPSSIRNHELGTRHKENVANRITAMREANVKKAKEEKEAVRAIQQIEEKAKRSYQKDIAKFEKARESNAHVLIVQNDGKDEWEHDITSGYYYNQSNGLYYDPNSGFYYSDAIGKWVTQEEAYATVQILSDSKDKPNMKRPVSTSGPKPVAENKGAFKSQNGPSPGPVVAASLNPMRSVKGAPSSLAVGKRKRPDEKTKVLSVEEAAAQKARESARKRVEEREKPLLGLYNSR